MFIGYNKSVRAYLLKLYYVKSFDQTTIGLLYYYDMIHVLRLCLRSVLYTVSNTMNNYLLVPDCLALNLGLTEIFTNGRIQSRTLPMANSR